MVARGKWSSLLAHAKGPRRNSNARELETNCLETRSLDEICHNGASANHLKHKSLVGLDDLEILTPSEAPETALLETCSRLPSWRAALLARCRLGALPSWRVAQNGLRDVTRVVLVDHIVKALESFHDHVSAQEETAHQHLWTKAAKWTIVKAVSRIVRLPAGGKVGAASRWENGAASRWDTGPASHW